jgi:Hypothetical glycosyl hydrolase 6
MENTMNHPGMPRLGWHFDFHSHKDIRINDDPDTDGFAKTLAENGVEEIITFAKGHGGFAYYPSEVGTIHPRMKGDAFGDIVASCKKEGLEVLAYVSFGIDGEAGRLHYDWLRMDTPGKPHFITEDWFSYVCPFTGYMDDLMLPMIAEIVKDYPVDGFFFDTMSALNTCYCESCCSDFRKLHGRELPADSDSADWGLYGQFRRERGYRMIERLCSYAEKLKPGLKIGFNQLGTPYFPEPMPKGLTCVTLDFTTALPQSLQGSLCAAFGSTSDKPCDTMLTIFNQGWEDWTPRSLGALELTSAAIWAHGSRPYLGTRTHPENRLTKVSEKAIAHMGGVQEEMAAHYPDAGATSAPDLLLLHGPESMYGPGMGEFARNKDGVIPLRGAHGLLVDCGCNFGVVAEAFLAGHLANAPLVILPEMPAISSETDVLLRDYVNGGGSVLITGRLPLCDGTPISWAGVSVDDAPWQDHIYVPDWDGDSPEESVLIRGDFHNLSMEGAEAVCHAIQPYDCTHGVHFGWGIAPPAREISQNTALTQHRVRNGTVWYLEPNLFSNYAEQANWTQIAWCRALLEQIQSGPLVRVICPSAGMEPVAHSCKNTTWVFLINHGAERIAGSGNWARSLGPVPRVEMTVQLTPPEGRRVERVMLHGQEMQWASNKDGTVSVDISMEHYWRMLRVDWT